MRSKQILNFWDLITLHLLGGFTPAHKHEPSRKKIAKQRLQAGDGCYPPVAEARSTWALSPLKSSGCEIHDCSSQHNSKVTKRHEPAAQKHVSCPQGSIALFQRYRDHKLLQLPSSVSTPKAMPRPLRFYIHLGREQSCHAWPPLPQGPHMEAKRQGVDMLCVLAHIWGRQHTHPPCWAIRYSDC